MAYRTGILYGESGSSKTTQLYFLAKWLRAKWEKEKNKKRKVIRLVTADGGGIAPFQDSGMIEEGFVDVLDLTSSKNAYGELRAIAEGRWTKKYQGEETEWSKYLEDEKTITGAYFIEGLAAIGELWLRHMSHKTDGRAGFKHSVEFQEEVGGDVYHVGGLDKGHYGLIQTEIMSIVKHGFNALDVEMVMYTSLVAEGKDKVNKEMVFGPATVGVAQAAMVPTWVGDCFHLEDRVFVVGEGENKKKVGAKVAWMKNHLKGEEGLETKYLSKVRLLPEKLKDFDKKFGKGCLVLMYDKGIEQFYEWVWGKEKGEEDEG